MGPNPQFSADLITFTEETLNGKLHFLCSVENFVLCKKIFYAKINIADLTNKLMLEVFLSYNF